MDVGRRLSRGVLGIAIVASAAILQAGCASVGSLPASTAEVDFSQVGRGPDKAWHDGAVYTASVPDVMRAAVAALQVNGFKIERQSDTDCSVVGSTPTTIQTWNSVVGVYCRPRSSEQVEVHVMAKGTKDVNPLAGDATVPIPPRIISSITSALTRAR